MDAYNAVCLKTLDLLLRLKRIPHIYTNWIINFLSKRVLVFGNCREEVCGGIPQGSCLSPLLLNIYSKRLHQSNDNSTKIFQFADDFVIMVSHKVESQALTL